MKSELYNTEVNLSGLLEVLGKNLYSTPAVAIRELIQNAHDACMRRKIESDYKEPLSILLNVDPGKKTLWIEDNGSGLTHAEVLQYLATIGAGYTRVLRNKTDDDEMIGYFGLGFLSAYIVADRVDVWTTSYQSPDETWHFSSKGGKRFSLTPTKPQPIGTQVRLQLSTSFTELSALSVVAALVRKYCCLLPIPIKFKVTGEQLNDLTVPWRLDSTSSLLQKTKTRLRFAQIFEEHFEPICTIEIPSENELKTKGILWIQDASGYSTSDYRNVSIFIRNMHITHEGRDLLPLWAGFVGCVIDTTALTPTASREDVRKDEAYHALKNLLAKTLIEGLRVLPKTQPENWRRIILRHNQALLGAALVDDALFNVMQYDLTLSTTQGDLKIKSILEKSNGRIIMRVDSKNNYEEVLFKASMTPVVLGYLFAADGFCRKYAKIHNIELVQLGSAQSQKQLFTPVTLSEQTERALKKYLVTENESLVACHFKPASIPMLFLEDKETKLKQRLEQDAADKRIGAAALALARLHTQTLTKGPTKKAIVNLANPLIQAISTEAHTPDTITRVAHILRSYMLTVCYDISDDDTNYSEEMNNLLNALQHLLSRA